MIDQLLSLFRHELRSIFMDKVIMLTVFGGVVLYSFLYPLPYSRQVPRNQRIAVIDHDNTSLSRELLRWIDATPEVAITSSVGSIALAEEMLSRREVTGFVVIPRGFHRDLLLARPVSLPVAGDAAFFLVYSAVAEGVALTGGTLSAGVKVVRRVAAGEEIKQATRHWTAFSLNSRPVFNTTLGYVNYVVPAVFVLILQQTLLIGTGVLGGTQNSLRRAGQGGYWQEYSAWQILAVRTLIFVAIYCLLAAYYFGFCFEYYVVPHHASALDMLRLTIPFLLAVTTFGIAVGQLLTRRDQATQIVLFSSLPLVFTSGFVWPTHLVPAPLLLVSNFVPSTPGIQAFLRLNQMGASFDQVMPLAAQLWAQAVLYGLIAWWLIRRAQRHAPGSSLDNSHRARKRASGGQHPERSS